MLENFAFFFVDCMLALFFIKNIFIYAHNIVLMFFTSENKKFLVPIIELNVSKLYSFFLRYYYYVVLILRFN